MLIDELKPAVAPVESWSVKMFLNLRIEGFVLFATLWIHFCKGESLDGEGRIVKEALRSILKDLDVATQNVLDDPQVLGDFSRKATAAFQSLLQTTRKSGDKEQMSDCYEKHYVPLLTSWGGAATQGMLQCAASTSTHLRQIKEQLQHSSRKLSRAADAVRGITTTCYSKKLKTNRDSLLCLKTYKKTADGFVKLYKELIADAAKVKNLYSQSEKNGRLCVEKVLDKTGIDFFRSMDTTEKCFVKR